MKKHVFTLFLFICALGSSQAHFNTEGYDVTFDDISISTFSKEPKANALVVYETINTYAYIERPNTEQFYLTKEIQRKIKILDKSGLKYANISINLANNILQSEKVKNLVATTYNIENNKIVTTELDPKNATKKTHDKKNSSLSFTFPNVKVGSVIAYSYTIISPFMENLSGWQFQEDIPKLYSKYSVSIPANHEYDAKLYGNIYLTKTDSKVNPKCFLIENLIPGPIANRPYLEVDCTYSYYIMENIPAIKNDDYTIPDHASLARIEYTLSRFKSINGNVINYKNATKTFDQQLKKSNIFSNNFFGDFNVEEILPDSIIRESNNVKKSKDIYSFVQNHYSWNGVCNILPDKVVSDLKKDKIGNSAFINLALLNLLQESKIHAKPVLLSTRNNGYLSKNSAQLSDFNYLIVEATVNGKTYLLDATEKFLTFGELPFRCLNQHAKVLNAKNKSKWIEILPENPTSAFYNVTINANDLQNISAQVNSKKIGYRALSSKTSYFQNKNNYLNNLKTESPNKDILDHSVKTDVKSADFSENYKIKFNLKESENNITINPILIKFLTENPFKQDNRVRPIDFGFKDNFLYSVQLHFNNDFAIKRVPKETMLELPEKGGTIALSSKIVGNSVNVLFKVNFNRAIYEPEFYDSIKEFINRIIEIQNNSLITLERKSNTKSNDLGFVHKK